MKFIISLSLLSLPFLSSAETSLISNFDNSNATEIVMDGPGKRHKKSRRINKKRKRKCAKFGRRSFAG